MFKKILKKIGSIPTTTKRNLRFRKKTKPLSKYELSSDADDKSKLTHELFLDELKELETVASEKKRHRQQS